jgi:SsrA-binding protein
MSEKINKKTVSTPSALNNKKARFEFEILETVEAGMLLVGSEVKSLRAGQGSIAEAYVGIRRNEPWIIGSFIAPYEQAGKQNHDPKRERKLLMHKREIAHLLSKVKEKGLTIVPLKLYFNNRGLIKLEIGLARGKKLHDKRETLRDRDMKRQVARDMRKYK